GRLGAGGVSDDTGGLHVLARLEVRWLPPRVSARAVLSDPRGGLLDYPSVAAGRAPSALDLRGLGRVRGVCLADRACGNARLARRALPTPSGFARTGILRPSARPALEPRRQRRVDYALHGCRADALAAHRAVRTAWRAGVCRTVVGRDLRNPDAQRLDR